MDQGKRGGVEELGRMEGMETMTRKRHYCFPSIPSGLQILSNRKKRVQRAGSRIRNRPAPTLRRPTKIPSKQPEHISKGHGADPWRHCACHCSLCELMCAQFSWFSGSCSDAGLHPLWLLLSFLLLFYRVPRSPRKAVISNDIFQIWFSSGQWLYADIIRELYWEERNYGKYWKTHILGDLSEMID